MSYFTNESLFRRKERLNKIRQNFILLNKAREYFESDNNRSRDDEALTKVENLYTELEQLGVEKTFSAALFIFGAQLTNELTNQFSL